MRFPLIPLQNILKSLFKIDTPFNWIILTLFALTIYSIPTFSFIYGFSFITWGLTIALFVLIVLKIIFIDKIIQVDYISCSIILFVVLSVISSALNGFVNFSFTSIFMSISTFIVYTFLLNNKKSTRNFIMVTYIASVMFLVTFIISNFNSLIHFDFERLGGEFGNVNDVAIFIGICTAISIYYSFFGKTIFLKIFAALILVVSAYCGLSTGARILIFTTIFCFFTTIICFFGKKRWYFSIMFVGIFAIALILIFSLPTFYSLKIRLLSMFSSIFGINGDQPTYVDHSSINRVHMFFNGLEMMMRKPLFGYGFHGFHNYSSFGEIWSHNNFSETLVCFGLLGTICYFYPFVVSLKRSVLQLKYSKNITLLFVLFVFYFICMFSFAFDVQKLFSFTAGILYAGSGNGKTLRAFSFKNIVLRGRKST